MCLPTKMENVQRAFSQIESLPDEFDDILTSGSGSARWVSITRKRVESPYDDRFISHLHVKCGVQRLANSRSLSTENICCSTIGERDASFRQCRIITNTVQPVPDSPDYRQCFQYDVLPLREQYS
jgi:hypothetical protein